MFKHLFRNWLQPRKPATVLRRVRLQVEKLEDRWAPALRVWDGGALLNDNWSDNRNWEDNIAPVEGDELLFPFDVQATDRSTVNDLPANTRFSSVEIQGDYTLTGSSILVGAATGGARVETSGNVQISIGIGAFNNLMLVFQLDSGTLNMSGPIAGQAGIFIVTQNNSTMSMTGSAANSYTGATSVSGKLALARSAGTTTIPGDLLGGRVAVITSNQIANNSRVESNITFHGVSETVASLEGSVELINSSVTTGSVKGALTLGSSSTLTTGSIDGTAVLGDGVNITTGSLIANGLTLGSNSRLTAGNAAMRHSADVTLNSGSVLTVSNLLLQGGVDISGLGTLALNGNATFEVDAFLNTGPFPESDHNQINIPELRLGNANRTFNVVNLGSGASTIINAAITGAAGVGITKNGNGTLVFGGDTTNTYNGTTTVNDGSFTVAKSGSARAISGPLVVGTNDTNQAPGSVRMVISGGDDVADNQPFTINRSGFVQLFAGQGGETIGPLTLQGGVLENFDPLTIAGEITTLASDVTAEIFSGNLNAATLTLGARQATITKITVADGPAAVDLRITEKFAGGDQFRKQGAGLLQTGTFGVDHVFLDAGELDVKGGSFTTNVTVNGGALAGDAILNDVTLTTGSIANPAQIGLINLRARLISFARATTYAPNAYLTDLGGPRSEEISGRAGVILGDATGFPVLDFRPTANFTPGMAFTIIRTGSNTPPVNGKFRTPQGGVLDNGTTFTTDDGQSFTIRYDGGPGKDVVVTRNSGPAFQNRSVTTPIFEGQVATLTGTITEPDAGDAFFLDVNWGDGTPVQTYTFPPGSHGQTVSVTHRYVDDGNFNIFALWRDPHGGGNSATLPISVLNVAPDLTDLRFELDRHNRVTLTGRIVDPGRDSYTLVVHWGDGHKETYRFAPGTTHFEVHHQYSDPGHYKVRLNLTDDDGGTDLESIILDLAARGRRDDAWWIALFEFLRD